MAGLEAFGSNGTSETGGLLGKSILESAILSTSLEDNSAYLGLSQALKTAVGSDPLTASPLTNLNNLASSTLTSDRSLSANSSNLPSTNNSLLTTSKDLLTGTNQNTPLLTTSTPDPLTGNKSPSSTLTAPVPVAPKIPNYAIRSEGTVTVNGSSDFDGEPLDLSDDALIYGAKGFTINGNTTLPVQRDAAGNPIKDAKGLPLLVDKAVAVSTGYSTSSGPSNKYAGLLPAQVIPQQTVVIPAYSDIVERELLRRTPTGTATVTFNAATSPINNASQWASKFPAPGTATNPTLVRVTGGSLTIPSNVNLSNYIITVDAGDINFNGSNQNLTNVVLVAKSGNINLANVQASDVSIFASGSITASGGARFAGRSLLANSSGNINFDGATKTTNTSDRLTVISQGCIAYNGATTTRGTFLSAKDFTYNGKSTLYGSISAKGNILFNGNATVIADFTDPTPPTISVTLVRDTAPDSKTNTDRITFDSAIKGNVTDASLVTSFKAGFDSTSTSSFTSVLPQLANDGSFNFTASQLTQIAGGTLADGVHTLHLQAQDLYGNLSPVSDFTFTLDTTILVPTFNLAAASDSGVVGDYRTKAASVTLTGKTEANAKVLLSGNPTPIAADALGNFNFTNVPLTPGNNSFTVTATDIAGNQQTYIHNIYRTSPPTGVNLATPSVLENSLTATVVGQLSTSDPDRADNYSYTLVDNAGGRFKLVGDKIQVDNGSLLDFETNKQHQIQVRTTDSEGDSYLQTITIGVVNVNEAPTNLVLSNNRVAENSGVNGIVGTFSSTDPDAGDTKTYTLTAGIGDLDNAQFTIVGDKLQLKPNPDFETKSSYQLRVKVTDLGGLSSESAFTVNITNVNEAPTAINLSNSTLAENVYGGTTVGNLSAIDPDLRDAQSFSLVAGTGSTDNSAFTIVGERLIINNSPDFETKNNYSLRVRATDLGGLTFDRIINVNITDINETPIFTSTPILSADAGKPYNYTIVTTDPDTGDTRQITSALPLPSWLQLVDNRNGTATLSGNPSAANLGNYHLSFTVTDLLGAKSNQEFNLEVAATTLTLIEGTSFNKHLEVPVNVPVTGGKLSFRLASVAFDLQDTQHIKDALEIALVDAQGKSLVTPFQSGRDGFFNWTEGENVVTGKGASYDATTGIVTLDLTGVKSGAANLVFRLVNDDKDTTTTVALSDIVLSSNAPLSSPANAAISQLPTAPTPVAPSFFNSATDVSPSIVEDYHRTSFDAGNNQLFANVALTNQGSYSINGTLVVVVKNISDPSVRVLNADGFTPEGLPYYTFTASNGKLDPSNVTGERTLVFKNPNGVQFSYDLTVLAEVNSAPVIKSQPELEVIAGKQYRYQVKAEDLNGDSLSYKLLSAPGGMTIDPPTGSVNWNTTAGDVGNERVSVEVSDGRGGVVQQNYNLAVITAPSNRPPVFTSTPVVDAAIGTNYSYSARAKDLDGDSLSYSLLSAPTGMKIDPVSGLLTWKPGGSQLGTFDVTLGVTDGMGGEAQQSFKVQTQMEPGNHAPIIISQPNTQYSILRTSTPQVTGGRIEVSSPDLASIHGQKFLDVNGNGVWNKTGSPIELVPSGPVILTRNDDGSTAKLELGFTFNFFGQSFTDFYINNNGNITFNGPLGTYSSSGFPVSNFPIVAPFWADVDTRGYASGEVHLAKGTTGKGNSFVQIDWPDVGYYPGQVDKLNDFTLYIEDGGAEDLIAFAYRNMQWTTGSASGGSSGFGGVPAQIGFNAGDGVNFVSLGRPSSAADLIPFTDTQFVFKSTSTSRPKLFGEPGLDGITIELVNSSTGSVVATQVTHSLDLNGNGEIDPVTEQGLYGFENLANGNYIVREQPRDGWIQTSPTSTTYTATLNSGTRIENLNFGNAKTYFYPAQAIDPDGDTITYNLLTAPTGATIDAQTGKINWFPTSAGQYHFQLLVEDGRGGQSNQEFDIKVLDNDPNAAPIITSRVPERAAIGQTYTYQVTAEDSNYDSLLFDLRQAPNGMSIDSSTGIITWTPTETQIGSQAVTIRVQDGRGGQALQTFNLSVVSALVNQPPEFTTTPQINGAVGQLYQYAAKANDPDIDTLSFDLVVKPDGMTVDPTTGKVFWIPTTQQLGSHSVILRVQDGRGGTALQETEIIVANANIGPLLTSQPNQQGVVGLLYQYQVRASDPERGAVTFRLDAAPDGMGINAITGLLEWQPTVAQAGRHTVAITVSDGMGGETAQLFDIMVLATAPPNELPIITSQPRNQIALGQSYSYSVQATDPNNDPLTYTLDNAPVGMSIDRVGRVVWTPQASQLGVNSVALKVSDSRGGVVTQVFDINVVSTTNFVNQSPSITSNPSSLFATVNNNYQYNLTATDADNDAIAWGLDKAPSGMVIDPITGVLRWNPTSNQLGENLVTVRVQDSLGGFTTQSFTLYVRSQNTPPTITSTPGTQVAVGKPYTYAIAASDAESDALNYRLTVAPAGMTINATTGLIQWTPTSTQIGTQAVTVAVDDGNGSTTTQSYHLVSSTTVANLPPGITSQPVYVASVGQPYNYQVTATDPEGGVLSYSLQGAPTGMTIDSTTGLVQWTPNANQVGTFAIKVIATDSQGASAGQGFNLNTIVNHAPIVLSQPVSSATIGKSYRYDVIAKDIDNDALTYKLDDVSLALGIKIDKLGRINWQPTSANIGTHPISIDVTDSNGAKATQTYNLEILADNTAPTVNLVRGTNIADVGETIFFQVQATDNVGIKSQQLTINNQAIALDRNGVGSYKVTTPGVITASALVTDINGNTTTANTTVNVIDPTDTEAPNISLTLPSGNITNLVDIVGTVTDTNLDYYTLKVAPLGSDRFKEVFRGTGNVTNGSLGKFDPTGLENDTYTLRLTAVDTNGHISSIDEEINVAGDLKLGNFRLSFTDISIPVTGIPITLSRTYDTLTANNNEDFGYGWRMEFRDTDLRTNLKRDLTYEELGVRTVGFQDGDRIYITLPGGKREGFTFHAKQLGTNGDFGSAGILNAVLGGKLYKPYFDADKGVTSTLKVPDDEFNFGISGSNSQGNSNNILIRDANGNLVNLAGRLYRPEDDGFGNRYILTSKDGTQYEINATTGKLESVSDPNGNTLTYTDTDIISSTGQKITFERDNQGRIKTVTDPLGKQVKYQYDAKGDLVGVTDRDNNTTQFVYDTAHAHYLDKIIDPLGREAVKTEYDEQGRLKKTLDVNGQGTSITYDPTNSTETVLDAYNKPTTYVYDSRGNVLQEIDANGAITKRTYDEDNNLLSETDGDGVTTNYTYDNKQNITSVTDGNGNITRLSYNQRGQILSLTGPTGITKTFAYDSRSNLTSSIDADGLISTYTYSSTGQLLTQTGVDGQITKYGYDNFGNPTQKIDSLGNTTTAVYDSLGRIITSNVTTSSSTHTYNLTTSRTYDSNGRVTSVTDAQGNITRTEYNALGQMTSTTDAQGNITRYFYDSKGQITKVVYPDNTPDNPNDNPTTLTEYDLGGRVVSTTSATGLVTHYLYDAMGRVIETIYSDNTPNDLTDNPRAKTEYSQAGRVVAEVDMLGNRTEYSYDNLGRVTKTKDVLGNYTSYTYNVGGQITSVTDPKNRTTGLIYDDNGRQIATIDFDGSKSTTTYDALSRVKTQTNPLNQTVTYNYDNFGRVVSVTNPLNQTTQYQYDNRGSTIAIIDALGHQTQFEYDKYNRQVATITADNNRTSTSYDNFNRVTQTQDFNGNTTAYSYNNLNQITAITLADGSQTNYTYDNLGRLTTVTDALQQQTSYQYDNFNRRISTILALGQQNHLTYNKFGQLTNQTDFNGDTINYAYDTFGRIVQKSFTNPQIATVGYSYDAITSQLTSITDGRGTTSYSYDNKDRLATITNPDGKQISYGYDIIGNRTSLTANNTTTNYTYDQLNRLDLVKVGTTTLADYNYDAVGNLVQTKLADGTTENRTYDVRNRLIKLETVNSGNNPLSSYTYTLDKNGNRTAVTELSGRQVNYTYDNLNRLTTESILDSVNGNRTIAYTFDAVSNRLTRNDSVGGLTSYTYNQLNQVISTTTGSQTTNYTYDNNGSLILETDGINSTSYRWLNDGENRLVGVTTPTAQIEYSYDAMGNRVKSVVNGTATNYLVDTNRGLAQVLQEYDAAGNVLKNYSYGNGLIRSEAGQQQQFYHTDGLGTVRLLTNADGTVNTRTDYDAFGRLLGSSSGDNAYQFTGERRDAETGLDYLRARYYDSELGRFISRDAFGGWLDSPVSQNKYLYADGNPVNFTDPTGYFTATEASATGVLIGILATLYVAAWINWNINNAPNTGYKFDDYPDGFTNAGSTAGAATDSSSSVLYKQGFIDGLSAQGTYGQYGSRLRFGIGDQSWDVSTGNGGGTSFTTNSDITWAIQTDDLIRSFKGEGASYSTDSLRGMGNATVVSEPAEPQIYTSPGGNPSGFAPPEGFPGGSNGDLFGGTGGFDLGSAPPQAYVTPGMTRTNELFAPYFEAGNGSVDSTSRLSSSEARRQVMREQGIPISQQPISQSRNASGVEYRYKVYKPGGGIEIKSVQQQTLDSSHPGQGHWEAGTIKTDPITGEIRMNNYGRPKLTSNKSKADYD